MTTQACYDSNGYCPVVGSLYELASIPDTMEPVCVNTRSGKNHIGADVAEPGQLNVDGRVIRGGHNQNISGGVGGCSTDGGLYCAPNKPYAPNQQGYMCATHHCALPMPGV